MAIFVVLVLEGILQTPGSVLERKRGIARMEPNSIDVMFIGNSHAYCTFNPDVVEETLDQRVFNAGLPDQKIDMTSYTLQEMLRNQNPKVIVLEAFVFGRSHSGYAGYVANMDAMDLSLNKLKASFEIFPEPFDALRMSFRLFRCHNNWKKPAVIKQNLKYLLNRSDDRRFIAKGFYTLESGMSEETIRKYRNSASSKFKPVFDRYSIGYFKRITQLCRERGIRLVVAMAPFNDIYLEKIRYEENVYEKMLEICKEEQVEYIDFNRLYKEIGLTYDDFEDAFHDAQHTNVRGAEKVSRYMAQYLQK